MERYEKYIQIKYNLIHKILKLFNNLFNSTERKVILPQAATWQILADSGCAARSEEGAAAAGRLPRPPEQERGERAQRALALRGVARHRLLAAARLLRRGAVQHVWSEVKGKGLRHLRNDT